MKKNISLFPAVTLIAAISLVGISCSNPAAEETAAIPANSDLYVTDAIISTVSSIIGGYIAEGTTLSINPDLPSANPDPVDHVGTVYTLTATDLNLSGALVSGTIIVAIESYSDGIICISAAITAGLTIEYEGSTWTVYSSGMHLNLDENISLVEATWGDGTISINGTVFSISTMVEHLIANWY